MAGKKGFGAIFEYDSGAAVYVAVANITKMRPFGLKVDVIDMSSMSSSAETREKLGGMIDSGEVQLDLNYDPTAASHAWLKANIQASQNFRINMPSGIKAVVAGFISAVGPEIPHDNKMTCSVTLTISGAIPAFA